MTQETGQPPPPVTPSLSPAVEKAAGLLARIGLSLDDVATLLTPSIERAVTAHLQGLPELIQKVVAAQGKQIATEVAAELKAGASRTQSPAQAPQQDSGLQSTVLQAILRQATGGGQGGMGDMSGLVGVANVLGTIFDKVMTPMANIYAQGRNDAHRELASLAKTGYSFPWREPERQEPKNAFDGAKATAETLSRTIRLEG